MGKTKGKKNVSFNAEGDPCVDVENPEQIAKKIEQRQTNNKRVNHLRAMDRKPRDIIKTSLKTTGTEAQ